jgi:hypothetical protein
VKKGTEVKIPCKAVYANPYEHMSLPHPCPEDCQPCLRNKRKATKHMIQKTVNVPLPLKSLISPGLTLAPSTLVHSAAPSATSLSPLASPLSPSISHSVALGTSSLLLTTNLSSPLGLASPTALSLAAAASSSSTRASSAAALTSSSVRSSSSLSLSSSSSLSSRSSHTPSSTSKPLPPTSIKATEKSLPPPLKDKEGKLDLSKVVLPSSGGKKDAEIGKKDKEGPNAIVKNTNEKEADRKKKLPLPEVKMDSSVPPPVEKRPQDKNEIKRNNGNLLESEKLDSSANAFSGGMQAALTEETPSTSDSQLLSSSRESTSSSTSVETLNTLNTPSALPSKSDSNNHSEPIVSLPVTPSLSGLPCLSVPINPSLALEGVPSSDSRILEIPTTTFSTSSSFSSTFASCSTSRPSTTLTAGSSNMDSNVKKGDVSPPVHSDLSKQSIDPIPSELKTSSLDESVASVSTTSLIVEISEVDHSITHQGTSSAQEMVKEDTVKSNSEAMEIDTQECLDVSVPNVTSVSPPCEQVPVLRAKEEKIETVSEEVVRMTESPVESIPEKHEDHSLEISTFKQPDVKENQTESGNPVVPSEEGEAPPLFETQAEKVEREIPEAVSSDEKMDVVNTSDIVPTVGCESTCSTVSTETTL